MRPETLQSLSVGIVFIGLALVALGGFGTFHFGRQLDRTEEQRRTALAQSFVDTVRTLREDQQRVLDRVAVVEEKSMAPALPSDVAFSQPASPLAQFLAPSPPPASVASVPEPPRILQLPLPSSAPPNPLLPHLPAIAQGPVDVDETSPPPPATPPPPRLMLPPALTPPAPLVAVAHSAPPVVPGSALSPSTSSSASKLEPEAREDREVLGGEKRNQLIKRLRHHSRHEIVIRASAGNAPAVRAYASKRAVLS